MVNLNKVTILSVFLLTALILSAIIYSQPSFKMIELCLTRGGELVKKEYEIPKCIECATREEFLREVRKAGSAGYNEMCRAMRERKKWLKRIQGRVVQPTLKGEALLIAIETRLLRPSPILRRVYLDDFEAFWDSIEMLLSERGYHRDDERTEGDKK